MTREIKLPSGGTISFDDSVNLRELGAELLSTCVHDRTIHGYAVHETFEDADRYVLAGINVLPRSKLLEALRKRGDVRIIASRLDGVER